MFFNTFAVVSTLRASNDGTGYYNRSACCALVFGLRLNQTMFSLGSSSERRFKWKILKSIQMKVSILKLQGFLPD